MHFALSNRSALSGSFVANQMQDRQFPFCHCIPFKRFCSSDSDPDMMFQPPTPVRYQGSHANITTSKRGRIRSAINDRGRVQGPAFAALMTSSSNQTFSEIGRAHV